MLKRIVDWLRGRADVLEKYDAKTQEIFSLQFQRGLRIGFCIGVIIGLIALKVI